MNIFGAFGIGIGIGVLVFCIGMCIILLNFSESERLPIIINAIVSLTICIMSILISIGIGTQCEQVYVAKYLVQKETIECSLESDLLSNMERVQLVNKAVDINGELAERKAKYDIWCNVYFDNHIYDNVEFIEFGGNE